MTATIQPQPFSASLCFQEGVKKRSPFEKVKNVLTGRIFENWREQLLSLATVYYVIKAALSFFSCSFIVCFFEFCTAGFMAILRKEIADFTDFHKANETYREQNTRNALALLDLRKSITDFKAEVKDMKAENDRFNASNEAYEYNNQVHQELLNGLEETTTKLGERIREDLSGQRILTKEVLQQYLDELTKFEETKGVLKAIKNEISEERQEILERFEALCEQVNTMSVNGVQALREADAKLNRTLREISSAEARATALKEQIGRLEKQIDHLTLVRHGLQEDEARIREAVTQLNTAARRNVKTANLVAGTFKALFYSQDEYGNSSLTTDKMLIPVLIGGYCLQRYLGS